MGTVQHLGRDYRPTPDPKYDVFLVRQIDSWQLNRPFGLFFLTTVALDYWNIVQFLSFYFTLLYG